MIKFIINIFLAILLMNILAGCSSKILLPYEECPECQTGKGLGYCGSVSDVYEITKAQTK